MLLQSMEYKKWADERTIDAIKQIDKGKFADACGFVLQQLNHMVIVEELFISRLDNKPPPHLSTNTESVPQLDELSLRLADATKWLLNFASQVSENQKRSVLRFEFTDGKRGSMSVEEMLFHIINHGSYHRGSIAHCLDLAGVPHPVDGYGIYIHQIEPERRD